MKTKHFILCALLGAGTLFFGSCGSDDDELSPTSKPTQEDFDNIPWELTDNIGVDFNEFSYLYSMTPVLSILDFDNAKVAKEVTRAFEAADKFAQVKQTRGTVGAAVGVYKFCDGIVKVSKGASSYAYQVLIDNKIDYRDAFKHVKRLYPNETAETWWDKFSKGELNSFQAYNELELAYPFDFDPMMKRKFLLKLSSECLQNAVAIVGAAEPGKFVDYGSLANDLVNEVMADKDSSPEGLLAAYVKVIERAAFLNDESVDQDKLDLLTELAKEYFAGMKNIANFKLTERNLKYKDWYSPYYNSKGEITAQYEYDLWALDGLPRQGFRHKSNGKEKDLDEIFKWLIDENGYFHINYRYDNKPKSIWRPINWYGTDEKRVLILQNFATSETWMLRSWPFLQEVTIEGKWRGSVGSDHDIFEFTGDKFTLSMYADDESTKLYGKYEYKEEKESSAITLFVSEVEETDEDGTTKMSIENYVRAFDAIIVAMGGDSEYNKIMSQIKKGLKFGIKMAEDGSSFKIISTPDTELILGEDLPVTWTKQ